MPDLGEPSPPGACPEQLKKAGGGGKLSGCSRRCPKRSVSLREGQKGDRLGLWMHQRIHLHPASHFQLDCLRFLLQHYNLPSLEHLHLYLLQQWCRLLYITHHSLSRRQFSKQNQRRVCHFLPSGSSTCASASMPQGPWAQRSTGPSRPSRRLSASWRARWQRKESL